MTRLIYAPTLVPGTFVHFSHKEEVACLRDYSAGRFIPPIEIRGFSKAQVETAISESSAPIKAKHRDDWPYWHGHTTQANQTHGLSSEPPSRQHDRGLYRVIAAIGRHFENGSPPDDIISAVDEVLRGLQAVKDKLPGAGFNDYDLAVPEPPHVFLKGMHWTSWMLLQSRQTDYLATGSEDHDFHLLCHELNLRIPRGKNPFRRGHGESFEPDGLALRRDSTLAVVEVKGRGDVQHLVPATAQAFCGALAVHAKFQMLKRVAAVDRGQRRARELRGGGQDPYLSLYIMVDQMDEPDGLDDLVGCMMNAFKPLREVAYFQLEGVNKSAARVKYEKGIRRSVG